jgi:hypothetical protein
MAQYEVSGSGKDQDGNIVALCGVWGTYDSSTIIQWIQLGHEFYVPLNNGTNAAIGVVEGPTGPYLRTDWDSTSTNNLDDLPDC